MSAEPTTADAPPGCSHDARQHYRTRKGRAGCRECDRGGPVGEPHAPFAPGNDAAMQAGHRSERAVSARAVEYMDAAIASAPELGLSRFTFALAAWARAEARADLIHEQLDRVGVLTPRGAPRDSLLSALAATERASERHRAALGLTPASAAVILTTIRDAGAGLLTADERARILTARTEGNAP